EPHAKLIIIVNVVIPVAERSSLPGRDDACRLAKERMKYGYWLRDVKGKTIHRDARGCDADITRRSLDVAVHAAPSMQEPEVTLDSLHRKYSACMPSTTTVALRAPGLRR